MEPVKITDTTEWSSVDIFLFSNGQQYTPPRKYHLRSEELQWWETSLNFLGRTHYGSGHSSIELYTINGTKINGPLELINGSAYVAVEPPDTFIDTGYEEYLLKATRSWEKRVAQKSFNTETANLDGIRGKDPAVQINTDTLNTPDSVSDAASFKTGNNTIASPQKPRPNKPYQRLQRKSITSPKQIQKKKCDTHSAITKKLSADTNKFIPCPKKTPIKKYVCVNQKPSTNVPCKANETVTTVPPSCQKKQSSIKPEKNNLENKSVASKNSDACNTAPIDETLIIDLFNNTKSEIMSFIPERFLITNKESVQNILNESNSNVQNDLTRKAQANLQDLEKESLNNTKPINEFDKRKPSSTNENLKNVIENKSNDTLPQSRSEKQIIDEYVAQMNKGGVLLLKLKVKLKDCKTIFNRDKSKIVPMASSLSNLPKTEKMSQVDINISFSGELLKSNDQQNVQEKSLQSLLNKIYTEELDQINTKNPRVIIIQCGCRDYSNNNKCCMCDVSTNQDYEIECTKDATTLIEKLFETRCKCNNDSPKDENVLKTDMISQTEKVVDDSKMLLTNGTRVRDLAQRFEISDRDMSKDKNTYSDNKYNIINNKINNINERLPLVLPRLLGPESQTIENQLRQGINVPNIRPNCDKSTQTDWCNLVLEARQHNDDNYTLHLPSLHILKRHNL